MLEFFILTTIIFFCVSFIIFDLTRRTIQDLQYKMSYMLFILEQEKFIFPDGEEVYPIEVHEDKEIKEQYEKYKKVFKKEN